MHKGTKVKKATTIMIWLIFLCFPLVGAECNDAKASEAVIEFVTTNRRGTEICQELRLLQNTISELECCREYQKFTCQEIVSHLAKLEHVYTHFAGCEFPVCECNTTTKFSRKYHEENIVPPSVGVTIAWAVTILLVLLIIRA